MIESSAWEKDLFYFENNANFSITMTQISPFK